MKILFLRNKQCVVWERALLELKLALSETGTETEIEEKLITLVEEAKRYKFGGSPTILIDGDDVDQATEKTGFPVAVCRTYLYRGRFYEYPPKEMIIDAIERKKSL